MAITTIALHVEPDTPTRMDARPALPLAIAEAHQAHVTARVLSTTAHERDAAGNPAHDAAAREEEATAHLRSTLEVSGVRHELRGRSSAAFGIGQSFADQLRVRDLGIVLAVTLGGGARPTHRRHGRHLLLGPPRAARSA
jgi:hypothetical protein